VNRFGLFRTNPKFYNNTIYAKYIKQEKELKMSGISCDVFNQLTEDVIRLIEPKTALDIGPGQGKYAYMLDRAAPQCQRHALEISAEYATAYKLDTLYHKVSIGDAAELVNDPSARNALYDLVIIGDCIEHLPKSKGLDLINFLTYRCAYLVMIVPEFSYYDTQNMEHTESHIAVWSEHDLGWHDRFAFMRSEFMQIFILRGYQPYPLALADLVAKSNSAPSPVSRYGGGVYKHSHLHTHIRDRVETIDGVNITFRQP
jgi:hypothetical protein